MEKQMFSKPFNLVYEKNYPILSIGPLIYNKYSLATDSAPKNWIKSEMKDVQSTRRKQIYSFKSFRKNEAVKPKKQLEDIQLITQSKKTVEVEINLEKKKEIIKEKITGINNYSYNLNKLKVISNIRVPKIIDKTVNDIDLKAKKGILELYNKLENVYKIEQLLSVGLLGVKKNRILVPTRWSITSVDDILSKDKINKIILNPTIDDYKLFYSEFYKNKFYFLFLPVNWGYEQIEISGDRIFIDYELNYPKKKYASEVAGGYYAARLEVTNYLNKIKKQARVIVFRDIDISYKSLGVWAVREATRETLLKNPVIFESLENMLEYINTHLKINKGIKYWKDKSNIIKELKYQKRLFEFI